MAETRLARLEDRAVLRLGGADKATFLQGLISNDIRLLSADRALYAALLTPQGKLLFDLILYQSGEDVLIDADASRIDELAKRLGMYRMRAKVTISVASELAVLAAFGDDAAAFRSAEAGWLAVEDPRHGGLGLRLVGPKDMPPGPCADTIDAIDGYERLRLELGIPDAGRDMQVGKTILLEANFDELHGVSFDKGCFVGQELTARTRYRGLIKRRLLPVAIEGASPAPGTPLLAGEREAGEMRSSCAGLGIALLRLDCLDTARAEGLRGGAAVVRPRSVPWLQC